MITAKDRKNSIHFGFILLYFVSIGTISTIYKTGKAFMKEYHF